MSKEVAVPNGVAILPTTAVAASWTPQQMSLMVFAGIAQEIMTNGNKVVVVPDPGVAEAFLLLCRRTGLDPFARQIYAVEFSGKRTIVVGVDGFRIIAQRSDGYRGQIGPQWWTGRMVERPLIIDGKPVLADGHLVTTQQEEWLDAWVPTAVGLEATARPVAARVGVLRKGFKEPLWQVVTWKEFGVEPRFPKDNWGVRPAHMLGIRAETHALRRAFPNDLSGLYTPEDFDGESGELVEEVQAQIARVEAITDLTELSRYYQELHATGMPDKVREVFMRRAGDLGAAPKDEAAAPPSEEEKPAPTQRARKGPIPQAAPEPAPSEDGMTEEEWEAEERRRFDAAQRGDEG